MERGGGGASSGAWARSYRLRDREWEWPLPRAPAPTPLRGAQVGQMQGARREGAGAYMEVGEDARPTQRRGRRSGRSATTTGGPGAIARRRLCAEDRGLRGVARWPASAPATVDRGLQWG